MPGSVQTCLCERVLDEGLIGQGLQGGTGLGYQHEQGMCHVDGRQYGCRVVRVYIADKLRFHLEGIMLLRPVLQGQIHSPGAQVAAADTDLYDGSEFLTCRVGNLTCVYFIGKFCYFFLLLYVKRALVHAVRYYCIAQLAAGQLVKHQTLLAGVDHLAVIESRELLRQLCFLCKLRQYCQYIIVYGLCGVVVCHAFCHWHTVCLHTLCSVLTGHDFRQVYACGVFQLLIGFQGIQIFPFNHDR